MHVVSCELCNKTKMKHIRIQTAKIEFMHLYNVV
jgi:hypothetical protein